jgi:hypothetical protein
MENVATTPVEGWRGVPVIGHFVVSVVKYPSDRFFDTIPFEFSESKHIMVILTFPWKH